MLLVVITHTHICLITATHKIDAFHLQWQLHKCAPNFSLKPFLQRTQGYIIIT